MFAFLYKSDMDKYRIKLSDLTNGSNTFCFEIKDSFFESFPLSEIKNVNISAIAIIKKENENLKLTLKLEGEINNLLCDICADDLSLKITAKTDAIVQKSNHNNLSDDDIIFIENNNNSIDLKQFIFESIILSIPKKKRHKLNLKGELTCDQEMLDLIKKYSLSTNPYPDQRWEVLKNLK